MILKYHYHYSNGKAKRNNKGHKHNEVAEMEMSWGLGYHWTSQRSKEAMRVQGCDDVKNELILSILFTSFDLYKRVIRSLHCITSWRGCRK